MPTYHEKVAHFLLVNKEPEDELTVIDSVPNNREVKLVVSPIFTVFRPFAEAVKNPDSYPLSLSRGFVVMIDLCDGFRYAVVLSMSHVTKFRGDTPCLLLPSSEHDLENLQATIRSWGSFLVEILSHTLRQRP